MESLFLVAVFEDIQDDVDVEELGDDLVESGAEIVETEDDNVKLLIGVPRELPDKDVAYSTDEEICQYWKDVINEYQRPCCDPDSEKILVDNVQTVDAFLDASLKANNGNVLWPSFMEYRTK